MLQQTDQREPAGGGRPRPAADLDLEGGRADQQISFGAAANSAEIESGLHQDLSW